jgi:hypothetical protein
MRRNRALAVRSESKAALDATPVPLRAVGRRHVEAAVAEVAPTIRRLRHLMTVIAVCIPVGVVGGLLVLWHLGS